MHRIADHVTITPIRKDDGTIVFVLETVDETQHAHHERPRDRYRLELPATKIAGV